MTGQSKSLRGFVIKKEAVDDSAGCEYSNGMVDDARKRDTMMLCILRPNHLKSKHGRYIVVVSSCTKRSLYLFLAMIDGCNVLLV